MQLYFFAESEVYSYAETEIFSMRGNVLHHSQRPDYNTGERNTLHGKTAAINGTYQTIQEAVDYSWRRVMP